MFMLCYVHTHSPIIYMGYNELSSYRYISNHHHDRHQHRILKHRPPHYVSHSSFIYSLSQRMSLSSFRCHCLLLLFYFRWKCQDVWAIVWNLCNCSWNIQRIKKIFNRNTNITHPYNTFNGVCALYKVLLEWSWSWKHYIKYTSGYQKSTNKFPCLINCKFCNYYLVVWQIKCMMRWLQLLPFRIICYCILYLWDERFDEMFLIAKSFRI